jgi:hypothetical protein
MMEQKRSKYRRWTGILLLALLVSVFSFPEINLQYTVGIDPPLKWLFNHLFSTGMGEGRGIIFPHGPLAFLMYPLAPNFVVALFVTVVLQIAFVVLLFELFGRHSVVFWLLTAVVSWFVFALTDFNQLILSNIFLAYLLYFKNGKKAYKYWGFVLMALAFYVKAYVAILSGTITFAFVLTDFYHKRNIRNSLSDGAIIVLFLLAFWVAMYHTLSGFWDYCIGMVHLAGDNSAAASYYPQNNWLLLAPFLVLMAGVPFLQKNSRAQLFGCIFLLSFFACWKYGMAREDVFHAQTLLFFSAMAYILFLVYIDKHLLVNVLVVFAALALFTCNLKNVENYEPLSIHWTGLSDFKRFVTGYTEIKAESEKQNLKNIEVNRLPESFRKIIGQQTADIYPWDYTLVAANGLNWKHRPVIQSYAAYTPWLDRQNAGHFAGANAPEFIVVGLNKTTTDLNGGKLESIDNRYLLNDEPETMVELIKKYETVACNADFLVWQKRRQPLDIRSELTALETAGWNEWIPAPTSNDRFIRMKLHIQRNVSGRLKSLLYKDELYYVYLKSSDGSVLKYRIVPQNAADGIWISPFYLSAGDPASSKPITRVLLTCSNKSLMKQTFSFEWEFFNLKASEIARFLGKDSVAVQQKPVSERFVPGLRNPRWNSVNEQNIVKSDRDTCKFYRLAADGFSPNLEISNDSIFRRPFRVEVACWVKVCPKAGASLVIEVLKRNNEKIWHGIEMNRQIVDPEAVNHVFSYLDVSEPPQKVTVYVWNHGKAPIQFSEISVNVRNQ